MMATSDTATLPPMGKGEGAGPGRPRQLAQDEDDRASNTVVRLAQVHRDELKALVSDGKAETKSGAVRWLIEQSAKRRQRAR